MITCTRVHLDASICGGRGTRHLQTSAPVEMMKSQSKVELLFYSRARTRRTEPLAASVYQDHDPDQSALHSSTRSRFLGHKRALIHRTHLCVLAPRLIQRSIPAARPLTWGGRGRSCFPILPLRATNLSTSVHWHQRKKEEGSKQRDNKNVRPIRPRAHAHAPLASCHIWSGFIPRKNTRKLRAHHRCVNS